MSGSTPDSPAWATRMRASAWDVMRDSPYTHWSYPELPVKARARVDRTVAAVLREAAEELFEELLNRVEPGMVVRPNVIPELLRQWAAAVEEGQA